MFRLHLGFFRLFLTGNEGHHEFIYKFEKKKENFEFQHWALILFSTVFKFIILNSNPDYCNLQWNWKLKVSFELYLVYVFVCVSNASYYCNFVCISLALIICFSLFFVNFWSLSLFLASCNVQSGLLCAKIIGENRDHIIPLKNENANKSIWFFDSSFFLLKFFRCP